MRYNAFSYLYPPRPEKAVTERMLPLYEQSGFVAQPKFNGTCNVLAVSPDRGIRAMTRHATEHKAWTPAAKNLEPFVRLPGQGWYVFVTELLHSKVEGFRDINVIHDILVRDGEYLVSQTQEDRQEILDDLFMTDSVVETPTHYAIDENNWLIREFEEDFSDLYGEFRSNPLLEGLVLKNPKTKLEICSKPTSNRIGQFKCRYWNKNYGF